MLAIEKVKRVLTNARDMPVMTRGGLLLMVVAGVVDVVVHLVSGDHAGHHGFGPEHLAHLLGVVGMVLVLAGVVTHGARRQLRRVAAKPGGLDPNAHR
jgi:peptidoglycan/LPS O-acetylase OafA/YrhL